MLELRRSGPCALNRYLNELALCDKVASQIMVNEHHSTGARLHGRGVEKGMPALTFTVRMINESR